MYMLARIPARCSGVAPVILGLCLLLAGGCDGDAREDLPPDEAALAYRESVVREQALAANDVWHAAKLRGVAFRAIGQEPGWLLEITPGEKILLETDYGQTRQEFDYSPPEVERDQARTLHSLDGVGSILIEGRPCSDSMSGESFETTVTVRMKGRELRGCGRALF